MILIMNYYYLLTQSVYNVLITGYLSHEIISQSIFNFVYFEDRLVKLHALWKCNFNY
jgi:hypothetical protein